MLPFTQVDVFTSQLTAGNPVAVVHDADALSDQQMADFARWTNLSETTFLVEPTDPDADYGLRIFTTARELPFAGHPTLGSARAWLVRGGRPKAPGRILQECGAGRIESRADAPGLAFCAPPLGRGGPVDPGDVAEVADALRIDPDSVVDAQWADNGPGWVALLLQDAASVLRLEPDRTRFGRFSDIGVVGPYPPGSAADFEVRAFMGTDAAGEDPVTGSLNAAIAPWLIATGRAGTAYVASQGTRLQRRGRIHIVQDEDGRVWVGGDTVVAIEGVTALG